jgi:hypothetical protein
LHHNGKRLRSGRYDRPLRIERTASILHSSVYFALGSFVIPVLLRVFKPPR